MCLFIINYKILLKWKALFCSTGSIKIMEHTFIVDYQIATQQHFLGQNFLSSFSIYLIFLSVFEYGGDV